MVGGLIVAIIGGLIAVAGFAVFDKANAIISQGETLWGLGWAFLDISESDANMYRIGGIAGMVVGGIIALGGLLSTLRKSE